MPNTDHYQKVPDFFSSAEEGKAAGRANTNPRYKFFRQTHFTAGDYEQFLAHWDTTSHEAETEAGESLDCPQLSLPFYRDLCCDDVIHTFEYIFHKHKKGIFFKIARNELRVFLPFSKVEYTNDWSGRVRVDPKRYKGIYELLEASCVNANHVFDANRIHYMRDHWYANNGLLRYEYPISENDSGVPAIRDMLLTLCRERVVPDGEYFINKRDFPILKKDHTEAHECIYGENTPLTSHRHEKYCPILSMTTTDAHADIPIPTWDDWGRVSYPEGKLYGKDFLEYPDPYVPDYHKKKDTAVFRGASTGLGTTPADNPRIRFAQMSKQQERDEDGVVFLDCAITKWNCRPRKTATSRYYETIDKGLMKELGVGGYMTMREQAQHKFILHLPGHSEAYRLSMELATGSVVLLYPCRYKLWFSSWLRAHEHYVPIDPDDPQDVYKKIKWCKTHPNECAAIAANARRFYEEKLTKDAILDYWRDLLCALQKTAGKIRFPPRNMFEFQQVLEMEALGVEKKIMADERLYPLKDTTTTDMRGVHPRTFQVYLHRIDPNTILRQIEEAPVWKQSRNVAVRKVVVAGRVLCVKTPNNAVEKDILHECFIGQAGVNKLANACPMMAFQHGRWGNHIVEDFVEGDTLEKFLCAQKPTQVCGALKLILGQVSLLLHYAQAEFGFIHYDLYPWNIIVRENREGTTFTFPVCGTQKAFSFRPPYYPVLIDFGKSHIVYKNMHFANVSPFQVNLHQDALSILISSLFTVVQNHKLPPNDVPEIIRLVNYVGRTRYAQHRVFENMTQVKHFLRIKKKFSNMLSDDKTEFRDADPIRLFEHARPPSNIFRCHEDTSELTMSLEIYYSRFMIMHELSAPGVERRRPQHHKNPINAFCAAYMDYQLTRRLSPGVGTGIKELVEHGTKEWKVRPPTTTPTTTLPRFFSHPNTTERTCRNVSQYAELHKVAAIVAHATRHTPELSFLKEKEAILAPYTRPILAANRGASAANHMSLYAEFTSSTPRGAGADSAAPADASGCK